MAIGEVIPESKFILAVIGGLGVGYESLVTSMTTRFNRSMRFLDLEVILMNYDMTNDEQQSAPNFAHCGGYFLTSSHLRKSIHLSNLWKKKHSALSYYNRYNAVKFPHDHKHDVVCSDVPTGRGSMNLASRGENEQLSQIILKIRFNTFLEQIRRLIS